MQVTFDTNVLADIVSPETSQRANGEMNGRIVRAAIQSGKIQGVFCEALITLEGIANKDRSAVFGSTAINTTIRPVTALDESRTTYIDLLVEQPARQALDQKQADRFLGAFELGMKLLGVPRIGKVSVDDPDGTRYLAESDTGKLTKRLERYNNISVAIEARGVGCAQAQRIAIEIQTEIGGNHPFTFYLGSPRNSTEQNKIKKAIREWADGDSVAAHYGYNIDLFCSEDFGKNASSVSILDYANRAWLTNEFGIKFVTLEQLADMLTI